MGRWRVDYGIIHFSHKQKLNIVDLTLLISAHQGVDVSGKHRSEVTEDDFLWNYHFYQSPNKSFGLLTSNYFLVCYYLLYNSTYTEIDESILTHHLMKVGM